MTAILGLAAVFVVAIVLTRLWRSISIRYALLDVPNPRSSHRAPTPRGAGVAILIAFVPVPIVLLYLKQLDAALFTVLVAGGLLVGVIGLADDYRPMAPRWRLLVQFCAAALALALIGPPAELLRYSGTPIWHGAVYLIALLAIVWHVNLFNFMDGIDGIAGAQATFVAAAGAFLAFLHGAPQSSYLYLSLAAACVGFLVWNWPPARVFMGDVGSGFLGFALVVFALGSASVGTLSIWTWVTLMSAFIVDASVTVVRRLLRGERIYEAHRSHAYQWSARRLHSHAKVTVAFVLINLCWLLPLAWISTLHPDRAAWIALIASVPLVLLACLFGAGRAEQAERA